jgi:hypothetical protein
LEKNAQKAQKAPMGAKKSVRHKRPMRHKGPISSLLHAGSAKLRQIADNTQQGPVPRQERPPV